MPRRNTTSQPDTDASGSFKTLCDRVMAQVNAALGDKDKHILVEQLSANDEDWEKLMGEIAENEHVRLARRDDGSVDLFWTVPKDM